MEQGEREKEAEKKRMEQEWGPMERTPYPSLAFTSRCGRDTECGGVGPHAV
jgi:hypothetical protein